VDAAASSRLRRAEACRRRITRLASTVAVTAVDAAVTAAVDGAATAGSDPDAQRGEGRDH